MILFWMLNDFLTNYLEDFMELDKTKILIVDDSVETQNNIKSKVQQEENIEVVGVCQNVSDAYKFILENKPDIVIT